MNGKGFQILVLGCLACLLVGCVQTKGQKRYSRAQTEEALRKIERPGFFLGEFPLRLGEPILDGDTIEVEGLSTSLRLICIDTEETFKKEWERKLYAQGFEAYKQKMRGDSPHPVKMATPMGDEAKAWAKKFFEGVRRVRLERDHPKELRGFYGRYLTYVYAKKNGEWVNYNIEAVRAGMSPYYTKYGQSRRFHQQFLEAQAEAQAKKIGIWNPQKENYGDYQERLTWWNRRGALIDYFELEEAKHDNYIVLTRYDALLKLQEYLGREVVLLGAVGDVRYGDRGPTLVELARSNRESFHLVFFDKDVFLSSALETHKGEYILVRGVVSEYKSKKSGRKTLQIVVDLPGQIWIPTEDDLIRRSDSAAILMPPPNLDEVAERAEVEAAPQMPEVPKPALSLEEELDLLYQSIPTEEPGTSTETLNTDPTAMPEDLNFDDLI